MAIFVIAICRAFSSPYALALPGILIALLLQAASVGPLWNRRHRRFSTRDLTFERDLSVKSVQPERAEHSVPALPRSFSLFARNLKPIKQLVKKTSLLLCLCLALIPPLGAVESSQLELARKVIKATQFDRMFDQMGTQMQQMATQSMNLAAPNQTPAQKEAASKTLGEVMALSMDSAKSLLEKVDVIYAEVYSEAELKAMLAFFESTEGKSMLQKQPQIMQRMMPLVQGMQKELMPKIQQIVEKAKAEAAAAAAAATAPAPTPTPTPAPPK